MDPVANLNEQRQLSQEILAMMEEAEQCGFSPSDYQKLEGASARLAELVLALDQWMIRGGFSPWPK